MFKILNMMVIGFCVSFWVHADNTVSKETEARLVDPTKPAGLMVGKPTENGHVNLVLQQIRISPGKRSAVIGGKTIQVGEMVGEYQVIAIKQRLVQLKKSDGTAVTLNLFKNIKK